MVYQQQPQYGQQMSTPQGGYGQPPQPVYGAPPGAMPGPSMPAPEIKWSGLSTGGAFKVPVIAFIGRLTSIVEDAGSQFGLRLIEKYDQVQILESPAPWPWATIDISIKYSDREESGWGRHVASAKVLGIAAQAPNLAAAKAELIGKMYELRQKDETYGEDAKTGQTFHGDVWRFVRVVQPGQAQTFPQPQYAQPQPTPVQPVGPQVAIPAQQPVAQTQSPAPAPAPQATGGLNLTPDPSDTAAIRAKKLLNGRALNEWLGVALIDDRIKADPAFINSVYDQSFIVGLKASGQVTQGADGKFQVVS
uniref:Uncharacterized protein n=2 Tax=viral metagenome TaxID=1070528 RepID=A0A6M3J4Q6_9ZZZZ